MYIQTNKRTQAQQQTQPDPEIAAMKMEMEALRTVIIKKEKKRYMSSQYTPHIIYYIIQTHTI
jgi:hypothetical protein